MAMLRLLLLFILTCVLGVSSSAQKELQYDTMFVINSVGDTEIGAHINMLGLVSIGLKINSPSIGLDAYGGDAYGIRGASLQTGVIGESRIDAPLFGISNPVIAGVRGIAHSSDGLGVYGENTANQGAPVGVGGVVQASEGVAISGLNFGLFGPSTAVKGVAHSPSARAIYGESAFTSGTGRGVQGTSHADMGIGVFGETTSATGVNVGVKGVSLSATGYGMHAENIEGVGLFSKSTEKAGLISVSTNGIGAEIESQNNYGVYAFSSGAAAIYATSESDMGGYISGSSSSDDLVLGGSSGKLGTDPNESESELFLEAQNNVVIQLDKAKSNNAALLVLNSDGERVFILEENGNLTITGTLSEGLGLQRNNKVNKIYNARVATEAIKNQQQLIEEQRLEINKLKKKVESVEEALLEIHKYIKSSN